MKLTKSLYEKLGLQEPEFKAENVNPSRRRTFKDPLIWIYWKKGWGIMTYVAEKKRRGIK